MTGRIIRDQFIAVSHRDLTWYFTLRGWSQKIDDAVLLEEHEISGIDWEDTSAPNLEGQIEVWNFIKYMRGGGQGGYEWLIGVR